MRFQVVDKFGWPVERIEGRWFLNFLRLIFHGRRIQVVRVPVKCSAVYHAYEVPATLPKHCGSVLVIKERDAKSE